MKARFFISSILVAISSAALLVLSPQLCCATTQGQRVKNVDVIGLKHIPSDRVFSLLNIKKDKNLNLVEPDQLVKKLYDTGYFSNIHFDLRDEILRIHVQERKIISSIDCKGVKALTAEGLASILKAHHLMIGEFFNPASLHEVTLALQKTYDEKGLYGTKIETIFSSDEHDCLSIVLIVNEGNEIPIYSINFIGNDSFSSQILRNQMQLSTFNLLSMHLNNYFYSEAKLNSDIQAITAYYRNRGFYDFKLTGHRVSISPDRKQVHLSFSIKEGKRYHVSSLALHGDLPDTEAAFGCLINMKNGDLFSLEKLENSEKLIREKLGQYGYAFPTINKNFQKDADKQSVAIDFHIQKGKRFYIRKINILGNTVTRDNVIRREMRQFESTWYDNRLINLSKKRLMNSGYFDRVEIVPVRIPGIEDQVDVDIYVKEAKTGSVSFQVDSNANQSYSTKVGVSKSNIGGTGKAISMNANYSLDAYSLELTKSNPYFTSDNIYSSVKAFYRNNRSKQDKTNRIITFGGGVKLGIPLSEDDQIVLGMGLEKYVDTHNKFSNDSIDIYVPKSEQEKTLQILPLTFSWSRDKLEKNYVNTKSGYMSSVQLELGTPPGQAYYKLDLQQKYHYSFQNGLALGLNGVIGYGRPYGSHGGYPAQKKYHAGGVNTVRGYKKDSLGPAITILRLIEDKSQEKKKLDIKESEKKALVVSNFNDTSKVPVILKGNDTKNITKSMRPFNTSNITLDKTSNITRHQLSKMLNDESKKMAKVQRVAEPKVVGVNKTTVRVEDKTQRQDEKELLVGVQRVAEPKVVGVNKTTVRVEDKTQRQDEKELLVGVQRVAEPKVVGVNKTTVRVEDKTQRQDEKEEKEAQEYKTETYKIFLGGSKLLYGNAELTLPLVPAEYTRLFRTYAFLDVGNTWSMHSHMKFSDLRVSTGVGFSWLSPVGTLSFSLAVPLTWNIRDEHAIFQIGLGGAL